MTVNRYPEYQIFEDGRIIRFGKILKQRISNCGYPIVYLYNNKKRRQEFVHKLLLEAFVPKPDVSYNQGNHINGIKHDNRLENLEWCNNSMNQIHAYKTGLRARPRFQKIDLIQSKTIRKCYTDGATLIDLSRYFKVSTAAILYHIQGKGKYYTQHELQSK